MRQRREEPTERHSRRAKTLGGHQVTVRALPTGRATARRPITHTVATLPRFVRRIRLNTQQANALLSRAASFKRLYRK
jgi:hypothetical protein